MNADNDMMAPTANSVSLHSRQVISNATFKLGIRGFTSLLQAVSKGRSPRAWEKALEIKAVMEQRPDLRPNLFTYSVGYRDCCGAAFLSTLCAHRWVRQQVKYGTEASAAPQALISALGPQWEKALEVFAEMKEKAKADPECQPNTITYSVRIVAANCGRPIHRRSSLLPALRSPA